MLRKLIILLVFAVASASVPLVYQRNPELFDGLILWSLGQEEQELPTEIATADIRTTRSIEPGAEILLGRKVRIAANDAGHFNADFKLNGRSINGLVDTGATLVALNVSTARRIGIKILPEDLQYSVKTANGVAKAATTVIDSLQIGRIVVEKVDAVVLEDRALKDTLIGVSFLRRLTKYQVENGALMLVQ
ncbi:MAG: TIGR02281 family clan AA aspartic protease [Mesorhizobium sp.]|nr:TIGR02281 family clan AA aspartic protease [Mesorhizobium sp.]MBL8577920.1 TIGR02281 family clan AA aspartic protease [Mesorhizobium sp.]